MPILSSGPRIRVAERGLRHAHLGSGPREAALSRDRDEIRQMVQMLFAYVDFGSFDRVLFHERGS